MIISFRTLQSLISWKKLSSIKFFTPAFSNKEFRSSGFKAIPLTLAPKFFKSIESQEPLNPEWPVIKTFLFVQKDLFIKMFCTILVPFFPWS